MNFESQQKLLICCYLQSISKILTHIWRRIGRSIMGAIWKGAMKIVWVIWPAATNLKMSKTNLILFVQYSPRVGSWQQGYTTFMQTKYYDRKITKTSTLSDSPGFRPAPGSGPTKFHFLFNRSSRSSRWV